MGGGGHLRSIVLFLFKRMKESAAYVKKNEATKREKMRNSFWDRLI